MLLRKRAVQHMVRVVVHVVGIDPAKQVVRLELVRELVLPLQRPPRHARPRGRIAAQERRYGARAVLGVATALKALQPQLADRDVRRGRLARVPEAVRALLVDREAAEALRVLTLVELSPELVDMRTLVIIGSSQTRRFPRADGGEWVYTPRWYPDIES